MLEKIGKDLEKTNAKEELFSLRKKSWGLNVLAKKTTRRNKKKSLKQLKFKQADFEESYSPLNCSASFLWESASFLLFWLSAVKKKKKDRRLKYFSFDKTLLAFYIQRAETL